jgi:hypothetical protein
MTVRYHVRRGTQVPDYQCIGESIEAGAPRCLVIPGAGVEEAITGALGPCALINHCTVASYDHRVTMA